MADQTISSLNELGGAALSSNDELPIVDVSAGETKKITAVNIIQFGLDLIPSGSIDISRIDQSSTFKLGSTAIADGAITAAKFDDNTSVATQASTPATNNFTGRGWYNTSTNNLQVYYAGSYRQVVMPTEGIAGGAVTTAKIATNAITDALIQSGGLNSASIASSAITNTKISDNSISAAKLQTASVTNEKIALNTIEGSRIASETITTGLLADNAITAPKVSAGAIVTSGILDGAVTNAKIANATIAYEKLNLIDGDIPGAKITSATISGLQIASQGVLTDNIADSAITNVKISNGTIGAGKFAALAIATADIQDDAVTQAKIADLSVGTDQIVDSGVTGIKLSDNSSTIVSSADPVAAGTFVGQSWFNTTNKYEYTWDGTQWTRQAALSSIAFTDSTPLAFNVEFPDAYSAVVTSTLDSQAANAVLIGPASGASDIPTFRELVSADLPIATAVDPGAVSPGDGLAVNGNGVIGHSNSATPGTYAGAITIDAQGHIVSANASLTEDQIPALDASKIVTGTFSSDFLAANSVTADQLADYGIAQVSESAPVAQFAGQWWVNPNDRSAYIWVGTVGEGSSGYWLNLGYGSPTQINLRFGGTYNASGNVVASVNNYGIEAGLTVGQPLSAPNTSNNGVYLIITASGTGTTPAPNETLNVGNWILSEGVGATWTRVNLGSAVAGINSTDVLEYGNTFIPVISGVASQRDFNEVAWSRVQIATTLDPGIVLATTEITVASGTGAMTIGVIDDGSY